MRLAWHVAASEEQLDAFIEAAKRNLNAAQRVTVLMAQRRSVTEIAELLGCSRPTLREVQRFLRRREPWKRER